MKIEPIKKGEGSLRTSYPCITWTKNSPTKAGCGNTCRTSQLKTEDKEVREVRQLEEVGVESGFVIPHTRGGAERL